MTFPRIRAPGLWVLGSVIAPAEMEEFDQHQFQAVDGYGGGAYAPTARLVIGGAGVDFTGGTGADPLGPLTSTAAAGTYARSHAPLPAGLARWQAVAGWLGVSAGLGRASARSRRGERGAARDISKGSARAAADDAARAAMTLAQTGTRPRGGAAG